MSHDPFESWFDSQETWPSQWHAAQAAWHAAQEQHAAPALLTIGRSCVMCGHMNVWDVKQAAPRAPLSDAEIETIADQVDDYIYAKTPGIMQFARAIEAAVEAAHGINKGEV
jgi:hypothetical protein